MGFRSFSVSGERSATGQGPRAPAFHLCVAYRHAFADVGAKVLEDGPGRGGPVQCIKVDAGGAVADEVFALARGVVGADVANGFDVVFDRFDASQKIREIGRAHV